MSFNKPKYVCPARRDNSRDNRDGRRQYRQNVTTVKKEPVFEYSEKLFPCIGNIPNTKSNIGNVQNTKVVDMDFKKAIETEVPVVVEEAKPIVKEKVRNVLKFEPREYDESGWMINEDWIEWFLHENPDHIGTF